MTRRVLSSRSVLAIFACAAVCLVGVSRVAAQQPSYYGWTRNVIDNSELGGDLSCFDRPTSSSILLWGSSRIPYLMENVGNDLNIYRFGTNGVSFVSDADLGLGYNCQSAAALEPLAGLDKSTDKIQGASTCPGCRIAIVHVNGSDWTVDLGAGATPGFVGKKQWNAAELGATYEVGGTQYVWGMNVQAETCGGTYTSPNPGVWTVAADGSLTGPSYCFQDQSNVPFESIQVSESLLLYYNNANPERGLRLASISGSGIPQPFGSAVPVNGPVAFKVSQPGGFGTFPVYVITERTDAAVPVHVYRIDNATDGFEDTGLTLPGTTWSIGAISVRQDGTGFVYVSEGVTGETSLRSLFSVSGLSQYGTPTFEEVDHSYWNSVDSDFNSNIDGVVSALSEMNAIFEPGGAYLYLSRFRALAEFKYNPQTPQPPVANGSVTVSAGQGDQNGNPYPGDTITISNTTVSNYDQSAIWITDQTGAIPDGGGSSVLSGSTPSSRIFTIPVDLAADVSYTAHVEVLDSTNFPDNPDEWTLPIAINRAPSASFTVTPTAVLTGESVALSASTDGSPGNPSCAAPYHWTVQPPTNAGCPSPFQASDAGGCSAYDEASGAVAGVVLDGSGDYTFGLTVDYQHTTALQGQYIAQAVDQVATAAWGAPILSGTFPSSPTMDNNVSLQASGSRLSNGMTVDYQYVLDAANATGTGCSGQITGEAGGTVTVPDCLVGALSSGQHSAQIVFTGIDVNPPEVPSQSFSFNVTDTSMDFTWSLYTDNDNNQVISVGDVVRFTKTAGNNVTGWNFGAADCDGNSPQIQSTECAVFGCNTYDWTYGSNGTFNVVMTTADGTASHPVTVGVGSCPQSCSYSVLPTSISVGSAATTRSLTITTGQNCSWSASESLSWVSLSQTSGSGTATITVTFDENPNSSTKTGSITVTGDDGFSRTVNLSQSGSGGSGSPSFSYQLSVDRDSNGSINVGDTVSFTSTGDGTVTGWDFGAADCDGTQPSITCATMPCPNLEWTYGSSGTFSVTLHTSAGDASQNVSVASGSCSTGSCSYSLSPSFANVAATAGTGTFSVSTGTDCAWSASSQVSWVHVTSGSGTGSGTVSYTVDANTSAASRQGTILVEGKSYTINQAAGGGGGTEAGPLLIPAAASVQGEGGTQWKSDLRIFNPASQKLEITIQFVPQPGDETPYPILTYFVDPSETIWIDDIMYWFTQGAAAKGALIITYDPPDQGSPFITSRTYNQTDNGTFGQFIPVLSTSSLTDAGGKLYIPGVENSDLYRTNIGLVNTSSDGAGVTVTLIDHAGNELVHAPLGIPAETYMQLGLSAIAAQDPNALDITGFKGTVVVEVNNGGSVAAYGSVVDWTTGDPIFIEAVK